MRTATLTLAALITALLVNPLAAISFSPTGIGAGGATTDFGAFGVSVTAGGVTTVGTGSIGGTHNSANIHLNPGQDSSLSASPDTDKLPFLSTPNLPAVARPVSYDAGGTSHKRTKLIKKKVKVKKHVAAPVAAAVPPKSCWVVKKECCWVEVSAGYECRDYYLHKYARCHPVIEYQEDCGETVHEPKDHPKPEGRTKWEEDVIKNYDPNYGTHVQGYPANGESKYYFTDKIPEKPHGVTGEPYPLPPPTTVPPQTFGTKGVYGQGGYHGGQVSGEGTPSMTVTSESTSYSGPGTSSETVPPKGYAPAAGGQETSASGTDNYVGTGYQNVGSNTPSTTMPKYTAATVAPSSTVPMHISPAGEGAVWTPEPKYGKQEVVVNGNVGPAVPYAGQTYRR